MDKFLSSFERIVLRDWKTTKTKLYRLTDIPNGQVHIVMCFIFEDNKSMGIISQGIFEPNALTNAMNPSDEKFEKEAFRFRRFITRLEGTIWPTEHVLKTILSLFTYQAAPSDLLEHFSVSSLIKERPSADQLKRLINTSEK